jgi:hypothetical protein
MTPYLYWIYFNGFLVFQKLAGSNDMTAIMDAIWNFTPPACDVPTLYIVSLLY